MNIKQVYAQLEASKGQLQMQYEDWLQRVQPRLDSIAVQIGLLQKQVSALGALVQTLETQTLQTVAAMVEKVK